MSAPLPALELGLTPWDFSSLTAHSLATQAAYAESLGYRSFWLPENHFNPYAISCPCGIRCWPPSRWRCSIA